MSESFLNYTEEEILQRVRTVAKDALEMNEFKSTGVLSGLVETSARLTAWIYRTFVFPLKSQIGLDTATGSFLDSWGTMLGVERKPHSKTRGIIHGMGTQKGQISSDNRVTFSGTGLYYTVLHNTHFSKGSVSFEVLAENPGSNYNLDSSSIPKFINHVTGIGNLSIDKDWIIEQGTNAESDESYRTRIKARWMNLAAGNVPILYESEAMSVRGITEAKAFRVPQGYGSTRIVLRGEDNKAPSETTLKEVRDKLKEVGLIARSLFVEPVVLVDIKVELKATGNITQAAAIQRIRAYFLELEIGQSFAMQELYNLFDDVDDVVFIAPTTNKDDFPQDAIYTTDIQATMV